ncbi:MAG: aldo/keto reductase, partial [Chloroflexota bacterium]
IMDRYSELGGNFVDTADLYTTGAAETVVGRWLKQRGAREKVVLASKVYGQMGPGPNDQGLSRYHILRGVEDSLRRLQTDYLDLYMIHRWDPESQVEETLEALNDLVRWGKVRYIGCSNLRAWHLAEYLAASDRHLWSRFISMQPIYNVLNRSIESEVLPFCAKEGLAVMTYNPLAGGLLTGKYKRGEPLPEGTRLQYWPVYYERFYTERALDIVEGFLRVAAERGVTPAQLALAWILAEPRVTCPIVGARNVDQLDDTLGGLEVSLSPEERAGIPAIRPGQWEGVDQVYDRKD